MKEKKLSNNKFTELDNTSLLSLMDIPRIMSKAFLTNRFLIIRTFKQHVEKHLSNLKLVEF